MLGIIKKIETKLYLNSIKCIIWDYDGTLYNDQDGLIGKHLEKVFLKITKQYNKKITINSFRKKTKKLGSWAKTTSFYTSIPLINLMDLISKEFNKEKYIHRNQKIVNFVESTKNRFIHLILTDSTSNEVLTGLKKIGFEDNPFTEIISRDISKILKPNKILFEKIQKKYNLKKKNFLCVGDSVKIDINPAKDFGFKAIPIWEIKNLFRL